MFMKLKNDRVGGLVSAFVIAHELDQWPVLRLYPGDTPPTNLSQRLLT